MSDVTEFKKLLDQRFDLGTPRRHRPGQGLGEEEIFLSPTEVTLFGHGVLERIRGIRPKAGNTAPVRERAATEPTGHRLQMIWPVVGERSLSAVVYVNDGRLWRTDTNSYSGARAYERVTVEDNLPDGFTVNETPLYAERMPFGSDSHTTRAPLDTVSTAELFEYIPTLNPTGPWPGWE
jgi:hypothetical protein